MMCKIIARLDKFKFTLRTYQMLLKKKNYVSLLGNHMFFLVLVFNDKVFVLLIRGSIIHIYKILAQKDKKKTYCLNRFNKLFCPIKFSKMQTINREHIS